MLMPNASPKLAESPRARTFPHRAPTFDVYGYQFVIVGDGGWAEQGLASDFEFFSAEPAEDNPIRIELIDGEPPYDCVPSVEASVYTPRNVSYRHGPLTYIDYRGRALGIHDRATGNFRVTSRDKNLLYETAYLFLLSQISEFLDHRGLHRVHALAVDVAGRAVLVILPMGGGKSTLGADLLKYPDVKLISDDSPFVDRQGRVFAFPLHLGLLPGAEMTVPLQHQRTIDRMEFGPKILVNHSYFADRVAAQARPGLVFLGKRSLDMDCRIRPVNMSVAMRSMVANCVVGLGLFQGMEFIFQRSRWELANKARVAGSRLRNSWRLLRRSKNYELLLGRDQKRNARTLLDFAREHASRAT